MQVLLDRGISNTFRYKDISLSFLIDIRQGGQLFSLDTYYGYATGLYDITVGNNELGKPIRNSIADGGGTNYSKADGKENTIRADL